MSALRGHWFNSPIPKENRRLIQRGIFGVGPALELHNTHDAQMPDSDFARPNRRCDHEAPEAKVCRMLRAAARGVRAWIVAPVRHRTE